MGALLSGGPVLTLNSLLEMNPAQMIGTEVVDKETHNSSKGGDYFTVTVNLNGEEQNFQVGRDFYSETEIGELVNVELHDGAFGIGFAQIG
jgi:hypothetical protein